MDGQTETSWMARVLSAFLTGSLALPLVLVALAAGAAALLVTPREEEPQITVPLADVMVSYPGGSAEEVEKLVSGRLERMLAQIDGVEYVYSMSRPGMAVVTVRFEVGQDREKSLIKLYNKVFQNIDRTTPGIAGWVIKPVEIDDVPILNATLFSRRLDAAGLYRVGEEVAARLQGVEGAARVSLTGGPRRVVQVDLDPEKLGAYHLGMMDAAGALKAANAQAAAGEFAQAGRQFNVEAGPFLRDVGEVRGLVVGLHDGKPVYLRDVAAVTDGPEEETALSRIGFGPGTGHGTEVFPAVTVALAKKKGTNAVSVAAAAERALDGLRGTVIPDDVDFRITRNYGETANEKVLGLVEGLALAILTVIGMIALVMNWRAGAIVAAAVPVTYAMTLLANLLLGYTINRVTLFALILALGLLVDDPIVGVENIHRHLEMKKEPRHRAVLSAMEEVLPPVLLATLAVMVAFIPLFFITGMMGPYMRPMAVNVPLAMGASLLVSLLVTPWLSDKLLPRSASGNAAESPAEPSESGAPDSVRRWYGRIMNPLLRTRARGLVLLGGLLGLFVLSGALALTGHVPLKMLPFDNKNEFQIVVDMPEGTTLEGTSAAVQELERFLQTQPEVTGFVSTIGGASPMDFNGLVRHYYLRQGPNLADLRVNLLPRTRRATGSHELVLRLRHELDAIAARTGASLKLVETPPGPPVLATLVGEVYGGPGNRYDDLTAAARTVRARLAAEPGVVDIDDTVEADQPKLFFAVDREKAGLSGITTEDVVQTLGIALEGAPAGVVHIAGQQNETPVLLRVPRGLRSSQERLKAILVRGRGGAAVPLGELGTFRSGVEDKTIYHKNQRRVVYVTAEVAGRGPAYAVLALEAAFAAERPAAWVDRLVKTVFSRPDIRPPAGAASWAAALPAGVAVDWRGEGEWKITLDVFRDLGIAFGAAVLLIYILLIWKLQSYVMPLVVMLSIPLTLIGIMPGFWLLNVLVDRPVGGFATPVFFTATAMIGIIALAGIVVRNGIILLDFIHHARARGAGLREAIVEAGAVRLRPIVLTAGAAVLGAWPITLDPIFSGLAWSLIFGLVVSTTLTLIVIPVAYHLVAGAGHRDDAGE